MANATLTSFALMSSLCPSPGLTLSLLCLLRLYSLQHYQFEQSREERLSWALPLWQKKQGRTSVLCDVFNLSIVVFLHFHKSFYSYILYSACVSCVFSIFRLNSVTPDHVGLITAWLDCCIVAVPFVHRHKPLRTWIILAIVSPKMQTLTSM